MKTSLYQLMWAVDAIEWACVLCGHPIQNNWASRAANLQQIYIKLEHSSMETIQMIQKTAAMGSWWLEASSWQRNCSCIMSYAEFFGETSNHPGDSAPLSPGVAPCDFWLFPKLKSPLQEKRFQTINEIQENTMGQLMASYWENCVRSPGASFEGDWGIIVLCTVFLASSSINVSLFQIKWLSTF